jgi:hypothetical protein
LSIAPFASMNSALHYGAGYSAQPFWLALGTPFSFVDKLKKGFLRPYLS